jgi:hypothetical protein
MNSLPRLPFWLASIRTGKKGSHNNQPDRSLNVDRGRFGAPDLFGKEVTNSHKASRS